MDGSTNNKDGKLAGFMKRFAPYSTIDRGIALAANGQLREISKVINQISGYVDEENEISHRVNLTLLVNNGVRASCTCCSLQDMEEQWCPHAVALLFHSEQKGMSSLASTSEDIQAEYHINNSTAADIADILSELILLNGNGTKPAPLPHVAIGLGLNEGVLLVKPLFNGHVPKPHRWARGEKLSSRELDNLLLRKLEEEGSFDEERQLWSLQSAHAIEGCLGIVSEFEHLFSLQDAEPLSFEKEDLHACMNVTWLSAAVEISMHWVLPDKNVIQRESDIVGITSQWTIIANKIYRLSPSAIIIAALFPHTSRLVLPKSQCGALLEILEKAPESLAPFISVLNPEAQPSSKVVPPACRLDFELNESPFEHFYSSQRIRIEALLNFIYPQPQKGANLVYLPDRASEHAAQSQLEALGFAAGEKKGLFFISGDTALDFVHENHSICFKGWDVRGIEEIKAALRIVQLDVELRLNETAIAGKNGAAPKKIDWFECEVTAKRGGVKYSIATLFRNLRYESERWIQLSDGTYSKVPGGSMAQLKTSLGFLDAGFRLSDSIRTKVGTAQALSLCSQEHSPFQMTYPERLLDLSKRLKEFSSLKPVSALRSFKGKLRSYQKDGLSWLAFLHESEFGGILADEMGLGKTVQTLAFLQRLEESQRLGHLPKLPSLIVAPTSVTTNWLYEARRFTPNLKVLLLQGSRRREQMEHINEYDLVITSYALLRFDRHLLENFDFYYLILDEAQNIKNHQAATTRAAKAMKALRRLALTGTPTENRPLELWSLFDFLMPGYLGNHEFFRTWIEKPILENGTSAPVTRLLNARTRPFVLRRYKADVEKDLPPKIETVLHVPMTSKQAQLYSQIIDEVRPRIFDSLEAGGISGARIHILAALLRLRQVCNHPASIRAFQKLPGLDSGKFNALKELLSDAIQCGRKILLYSQFREMLHIIRSWVEEESIPYCYLDGHTRNRQQVIDEFNNNEEVRLFLISLKAGGTGLNLTAADMVVIYDPWWNPAVELQAIDRTHRIGQTKKISVYRLVTEDSIENKVMLLKERKARIVDALINENGLSTLNLSQEDIERLFEPIPSSFDNEEVG